MDGITEGEYNTCMEKLEKLRKEDEEAKFKMPRGRTHGTDTHDSD